jgi:hypothetical protein
MQQSPRRRDVRDTCERVFEVLSDQLNESAEFGRSFLTELRNLLRDGISFEHAVLSFEVVPLSDIEAVAIIEPPPAHSAVVELVPEAFNAFQRHFLGEITNGDSTFVS